MRATTAAATMLALCACAGSKPAPTAKEGLGFTKVTAVEVCMAKGEQAYLLRLRCADGSAPKVGKRGNVGVRQPAEPPPGGFDPDAFKNSMDANRKVEPGERDPHIVDRYPLSCPEGTYELFLDMYHCAQAGPREAPPGLLLGPESP
jgi:hypothetical protein